MLLRTFLDFGKNEIRNAVAQNLGSAPASPSDGQFYYDNVVPGFRARVNGAWITLGAGSAAATTGAQGVVQLAGDLAGAGTTASAPLIGNASQLVNGSVGTPAVRFAASQTTGLYSATTDQVDLAAGGQQVFHSTSSATTLPKATTLSNGATITTGGLTVSAGGITVTLGGLTVSGGTTAVQALTAAGSIGANGGLVVGSAQTIDLGANRATNGATPSAASDLTTKAYVDALVTGLSPKPAARVATNAETLTIAAGSVTGLTGLTVDGVTVAIGDRVLIANAPASTGAAAGPGYANFTTQPSNGLYIVTGTTTNITLSRDSALSGANGPAGAFVFVDAGAAAQAGFTVSTPTVNTGFTYGTNNVAWTQFSGAGEITAGTGLTKSGNTISLTTPVGAPNGGLGVASPSAHGVLIGEGASAVVSLVGGTSGIPLLAGGGAADPSFAALSLSGAGVTGTLPIGNGGTNATTATAARTNLAASGIDTHVITGDSSTTSFTWTPGFTPKTAGAFGLTLVNTTTGAVEIADLTINQGTNQITIAFGFAPATGTNYNLVAVG